MRHQGDNMARQKLTSLTEIYNFFRTNRTPVYFVTPAPYNLLGIDQWVGNFEYITRPCATGLRGSSS